jgi:C-8 sterol isomerase
MAYVFDPEKLAAVAKQAVGLPHDEMCRVVIEGLAREYPRHVTTEQDWLFNLAAGATGVMTVLHASLSEYIIIFGTAIGTEGFSGRYKIEIYDWVLNGEMWTYTEDRIAEKVVTRIGERAHLRADQVKGWRAPDGLWLLEYGRGPIPTALPLALADAMFSAMDWYTIWKTLRIYGTQTARQLLRGKI